MNRLLELAALQPGDRSFADSATCAICLTGNTSRMQSSMTTAQGLSDFFYSAPDGLKLHASTYGEESTDAMPVVCLPGLSRNARDFHELALFLSRREEKPRKVVVFDYRGRGLSAYDRNWK